MFRRTRRRIIFSIMGSLSLLFVITLSVILFASSRQMLRENLEKLERYSDRYLLESQKNGMNPPGSGNPGSDNRIPPEPMRDGNTPPAPMKDGPVPEDSPDYQLSVFYSVAFSKDNKVLEVENKDNGIYEEEDLVSLARDVLGKDRRSGKTGELVYLVSKRPGYTLVAFLDNTMANNSMQVLIRNYVIVGVIAMFLLFAIAFLLARRIVRPLEQNDRKQKQFISDASHELKTPVSVIGANTEMLFREIGENEWLSNIRYENERMSTLLRQLLDLSRAESASVPMEKIDLSHIVAGDTLVLESLAFDQGKMIRSDIEENIHITGNRTQMEQLVSVLLDNAIRHSSGKDIEITLKRHGHSAIICVSNEGEEIPPGKTDHLFDRFYRLDEVRNSEDNHYGLGLSIAKAVVQNHKGNIAVSFREGKVVFTVTLPAV
jgi:signal transduction histidine kinase